MQRHNFDKIRNNKSCILSGALATAHLISSHITSSFLYYLTHFSNPILIIVTGCGNNKVSLQIYLQVHCDLYAFWSFLQPYDLPLFQEILLSVSTEFPCTGQGFISLLFLSSVVLHGQLWSTLVFTNNP